METSRTFCPASSVRAPVIGDGGACASGVSSPPVFMKEPPSGETAVARSKMRPQRLTFDDEVSDYFARQQVLERLQGADLPPGVQPQLAPLSTAIGEIYRFRVKGGAGHSPRDLRTIEDWTVERYLRMTPGVADVVSMGGLIKRYEVNPDLAKMKYYNLTMQQVFTALGRGNANAGGNYVEQGAQQYLIRGIGLLRSAADIGNIVVASHNGTPVLKKDIAGVIVSAVPRQGIVGQDDDDDIVNGIVLMRKGENPSQVLRELKERVDTLNGSILQKGVRIVSYYDRTWLIHTTLKTVFKNLLEGASLVSVVLFIFSATSVRRESSH